MKTSIRFVFLLILITYSRLSHSQFAFEAIDSFAISIGSCDSMDIPTITNQLTRPFTDQISKTRAIYTWIANNINYDCPAYHIPTKRVSEPEKVLKLRKAVCEGYANLFQEMCSNANIQCLTIDGYARVSIDDIGNKSKAPNHTWNAVQINGVWKLIDVTWASGVVDKKVKYFTKLFSDFYFFTDPNKFIYSHYPTLKAWLLTKQKITFKEFNENPLIKENYFYSKIKEFSPNEGIIKLKQDETTQITIVTDEPNNLTKIELRIDEGTKVSLLPCEIKKVANTVTISFNYSKPGIFPLYLLFDYASVMIFQFVVD